MGLISCQVMADMENFYDDLIIINLYWNPIFDDKIPPMASYWGNPKNLSVLDRYLGQWPKIGLDFPFTNGIVVSLMWWIFKSNLMAISIKETYKDSIVWVNKVFGSIVRE